jgi:hypothetical protein
LAKTANSFKKYFPCVSCLLSIGNKFYD